MSASPFINLSISALRGLYQTGVITPVDIINSIYDRLESQPPQPIWITLVTRAAAVERARSLDSNSHLPLYGIPFAVKDNIDVAGYQTTAGCPAFGYSPATNATVVSRLLAAGAILIGKTNLDQFATGLVGTRSPYGACSSVFNPSFISGGSSSGSAVAVGSGLVTFSLGTDTAGSGRVPAAFNNIVGLKPSRGLISTAGVVPACRSLDCISIFALSCADAEVIFKDAKGVDSQDPFSRSYTAPIYKRVTRIGVPQARQLEFFGDQEYRRLYEEVLEMSRGQGHSIVEIDFEPFRAAAELLYAGPYVAERFAAVGEFVKANQAAVDPVVGSIVLAAERWTAVDAYNALYKLNALKQTTAEAWQRMDVLMLPTTPTTYTIEEMQREPVLLNSRLGYYTNFVNLLDLCAVAAPAGFCANGRPFGVTVVGQAFEDRNLLAFAHGIQKSRAPIAGKQLSPIGAMETGHTSSETDWIEIGVIGAHLTGQPLNHQLTTRGAHLLRTTKTAGHYKLFVLTNTKPLKPGLVRVPGYEGPGIEIEIWTMPASEFGSFVAAIPTPLSIGTCALEKGGSVKGFLCEPYATEGMPEITALGSWRAFLAKSAD